MQPQRRKPPKSGIQRAPERSWRRHEQWVRGFACVAFKADAENCRGKIQCCHTRLGTGGGTALKPPSWYSFPACERHHDEQHTIGERSFEKKYGLDLRAIALKLARMSPDKAMKDEMIASGVTL